MGRHPGSWHQVHWFRSVQQQSVVSDQPSVAAPPERFAAHDGGAPFCCFRQHLRQGGGKARGAHIGGIGPE
jgi:hypothetical protein